MILRSAWLRTLILSSCALLLADTVVAQTPPQPTPDNALKGMFAAGLDSLRLALNGIGSLAGGTESSGAIWQVDLRTGETQRIGSAADLAWPVPSPNGQVVIALRGKQVVTIAVGDGRETSLGPPAEWRKLIGVAPDGTVLGFLEGAPRPHPALLAPSGRLTELPAGETERKRNALLLQEMRDYADGVRLEVRDSEHGGRGRDIFLIEGPKQRNLSNCGDDLCLQPSRSTDGNHVFYIRAPRL